MTELSPIEQEILAVLLDLSRAGLNLQLLDGKLVLDGPDEEMTPERFAAIREHKAALVRLLTPPERVTFGPARKVAG